MQPLRHLLILALALTCATTLALPSAALAQTKPDGTDRASVTTLAAPVILTPPAPPTPRINGPLVYGCRPGHPFLYRIPCQGEHPIEFSARHLPASLTLDPATGIITGTTPAKGDYEVAFKARNSHGTATRSFKIIAGDQLALTPPMGWNSWYVHFNRVTDADLRAAADAMIASGMADAGYQYVNVDDCWMNAAKTGKYLPDPKRVGPLRDANGNIQPNGYFPDMKALADYIHAKGLKAGLYTSPGRAPAPAAAAPTSTRRRTRGNLPTGALIF